MPSFGSDLKSAQKIVLAIDTSNTAEAEKLTQIAKAVGTRFVKFGLQIATAHSWQWCANLAAKNDLAWIADAKLSDIPNTVEAAVAALVSLTHPPFAVTIHITAGKQAMSLAQAKAGEVKLLGITVLTSLTDEESQSFFGQPAKAKVMQLATAAAAAGLAGVVASPQEVKLLKGNPATKNLLLMIPGSRSNDAQSADQARVATPAETIDAGADLLVIGREVTQAADPAAVLARIVKDIEQASNG